MAFPTDLDDAADVGGGALPAATTALSDSVSGHPNHAEMHQNVGDAISAIEAKVGIGDSSAAADSVLAGTASGVSSWSTTPTLSSVTATTFTGDLTGDVTGGLTGNVTGDLTGDVTGNADTATALETARTIGGVSFDGSANIDLPGVNTSGTQDTSGTAAVATTATLTDAGSDTTCFPVLAGAATGNEGLETDASALTYNASTGTLSATTFSGTATNANQLDSLDSTQFLRSDADDTTTGRLTIDTSTVSTAGLQSLNITDDSTNGTAGISIQYPNNTGFVQHGVFRMSNANVHRWVFLQEDNSSLADVQLQNLYYSGSLTSTSDETLKNNEGPALGLSFVNRLAPFTGTWIGGDGEKHQFLGAQSVEAALTAEGVNAADYGMVGDDSEIGPRTMSYIELVPVLVKAVQELTARLAAIEGA